MLTAGLRLRSLPPSTTFPGTTAGMPRSGFLRTFHFDSDIRKWAKRAPDASRSVVLRGALLSNNLSEDITYEKKSL